LILGKLDWLLFASEIGALICGLFFVKKLKFSFGKNFPAKVVGWCSDICSMTPTFLFWGAA